MNEVVRYGKGFTEFREELGAELQKAAEGFVRIGFLLKVARDTDVLQGSGYSGYLDFAQGEFGLDKTQVSRFIRINDRFSVDGNSEELLEQYQGFGPKKLGLMLLLPDEIAEELSPAYTAEEIEAIKNEVQEEQKVTPLDAYVEIGEAHEAAEKGDLAAGLAEEDILAATLYQIGKEEPEVARAFIGEIIFLDDEGDKIRDILAPGGEATYSVRVPGRGRMMLVCKEEGAVLASVRSGEKEKYGWGGIADGWNRVTRDIPPGKTPEEVWECLYGGTDPETVEEKAEVAPVQPEEKARKADENVPKPEQKPAKPSESGKKASAKPEKKSKVHTAGKEYAERMERVKAEAEEAERELAAAEAEGEKKPKTQSRIEFLRTADIPEIAKWMDYLVTEVAYEDLPHTEEDWETWLKEEKGEEDE